MQSPTYSTLTGHLAMLKAPAEVQYRKPYDSTPCFAVVMLAGKSEAPRADLISLHRLLMQEGLTCIDRTNEPAPSILVLAP